MPQINENNLTHNENKTKKPGFLVGLLLILLETVVLVAVAAYLVLFIHFKGPSLTFGEKLAMTLQESSALKFVPEIYYGKDKMEELKSRKDDVYVPAMDTSLITISEPEVTEVGTDGPVPDEWGYVDEDGDGIILEEVHGSGYSGYMMIVKDPSRVIMGSVPEMFGSRGYTVAEMVEHYGAIAGINAGGFYDPNGQGNGSIPDTLVVFDGKIYYSNLGVGMGFVGIDYDNILHVGLRSVQEIQEQNIRYGVCFGPVLVVNGEIPNENALYSGTNPRTAIGQRSDGAILLLVIDGRQIISIGASYLDVAEVMLKFGAVNACNLDGGSSTLMWYEGDYINNCASVIGIRPVPTTFLVMPKED